MMNEFRFKEYENPKTPESWIEKALDIPNQPKKKHRLPRPALISSAAAVVIVAAVLLTFGLHTKSPMHTTNQMAVISPSVPDKTETTTAPSVPAETTQPTAVQPVTTVPSVTEPAADPSPTATPVISAERRTLAGAQANTEPTAAPAEPSPTEPQPTEPVEEPTEAPTEPQLPDEEPFYDGTLTFYMNSNSEFYYSDAVYVHITRKGKTYTGKFTQEERAEVTDISDSAGIPMKQAVIVPLKRGIKLTDNNSYQVELYDENGSSTVFSRYNISSDDK